MAFILLLSQLMSQIAVAAATLDEPLQPTSIAEPITALPAVGDVIGRHLLRRVIGAGGMGTVYEAEHVLLEKRVAIKVLKPEIAAHPELRKRFVREGLAASRVRHPHVVDVTDAAEENGRAYLVMELLEGHGLDAELRRRGKLDVSRACEIILPICSALADAHGVGVVHRDMKPENVVLIPSLGRIAPKVVDFGISDLVGASSGDAGVVLGTPHYMAPEQARGEHVDGRADQYAVAVMLFEMVTGALPYDARVIDDACMMMAEVAAGRAHRLLDVWPLAPADLDAVLARAMSARPEDRFPTMEKFGRALLPFGSSRAVRRYRDLVDPGWSMVMAAVPTDLAEVRAPASMAPPLIVQPSTAPAPTPPASSTIIGPPPAPAPSIERPPTSGVREIPSKYATLLGPAPANSMRPTRRSDPADGADALAATAEVPPAYATAPTPRLSVTSRPAMTLPVVESPTRADDLRIAKLHARAVEAAWIALAFLAGVVVTALVLR
jgi:serine/threonine protein kinase